jgi:hypothetical protein
MGRDGWVQGDKPDGNPLPAEAAWGIRFIMRMTATALKPELGKSVVVD